MTGDRYDVVVIGGGLVGTALARALVAASTRTLLVDRHDAARATDAGAGILSPETSGTPDDQWFELARASGEHYRLVVAELEGGAGLSTGYAQCGALRVAFREFEDDHFEAQRERNLARSGEHLQDLTSEEAQALLPVMAPMRSVLYNPRAARVDGRQMRAALDADARSRGLDVLEASVDRLESGPEGVRVSAGGISVRADAIAVCGGAWTPETAAMLGVDLPVKPVRGQILHLRAAPEGVDTTHWPILQPVFSHYMVPFPEARVVVGATVEPDAGFDAQITAGGMRQLLSEGLRLLPGLADARFVEMRVGLRPTSADDTPILGRLPGLPTVSVCTGHGANGLLLGPYSAHLVAQELLGSTTETDLAPFRPDRFA